MTAYVDVRVSREFWTTVGQDVFAMATGHLSPPWRIVGRRGGRYTAHGPTIWRVDDGGFYGMDNVRLLGCRNDVRYVRPGRASHEQRWAKAVQT